MLALVAAFALLLPGPCLGSCIELDDGGGCCPGEAAPRSDCCCPAGIDVCCEAPKSVVTPAAPAPVMVDAAQAPALLAPSLAPGHRLPAGAGWTPSQTDRYLLIRVLLI